MIEMVKKMENMVRMEEDHASNLSTSVKGLSNMVVREILRSIALDSQKHAGLYTAILSLLKGEDQALTEEEYDRLEAVMKKHIQMEERMMKEVKCLLETEGDSRIKHLLAEIYGDEAKHHALMKHLLEAVIRQETVFEEDIWDMIWKDVPGHGAPIG